MKILILKPSSLGDVIQALPVLRFLKRWRPDSQIYWWLSSNLVGLLEGDPDLTGIVPFPRHRWAKPRHWGELWRGVRHLRTIQFDWVVDLQGLARSSLTAWLARSQLRIGVEDWREGAPAFFDVSVPRPSAGTHAVDWYLHVLRVLHVPIGNLDELDWIPPRPAAAQALRDKWRPAAGQWILVNPGARWPTKRWPAESFRQVVSQLATAWPQSRFAILGSASDAALGQSIRAAAPDRCLDLTGMTSLPELVEWIRLSTLVVTNDTGPMHIAAALHKPLVALFGPTDPRRTGPYGQPHGVLRVPLECAPCMRVSCRWERPMECLHAITPEQVLSRIQSLLNKPG